MGTIFIWDKCFSKWKFNWIKCYVGHWTVHGEFLSRNFESPYFKISLDWVLLGTFPTFQKCKLKKIVMAFLRNRPIVLNFHDFRQKLTIFSRLFTHFMQSFDWQWLKMCQKIISVVLRPPLWAKILIFWLKIFFFKNQMFLIKFLHFICFYVIFKKYRQLRLLILCFPKKSELFLNFFFWWIWTFLTRFDEKH
jgi:hypothetical protein